MDLVEHEHSGQRCLEGFHPVAHVTAFNIPGHQKLQAASSVVSIGQGVQLLESHGEPSKCHVKVGHHRGCIPFLCRTLVHPPLPTPHCVALIWFPTPLGLGQPSHLSWCFGGCILGSSHLLLQWWHKRSCLHSLLYIHWVHSLGGTVHPKALLDFWSSSSSIWWSIWWDSASGLAECLPGI